MAQKLQDFSTSTTRVNAWGWHEDEDLILGGSAGDRLAGAHGNDEIHGGDGDDRITDLSEFNVVYGPASLFLSGGSDLPDDPLERARVFEQSAAADRDGDVIHAPFGSAFLYEGGNDSFFGDGGDDVLFGYSGDDHLNGGADDDVVAGGTGDDTVIGGSGDDAVIGNSGNDILLGGLGDDVMLGGTGADFLQGGLGADIIEGGDVAANAFALQVSQGLFTQTQANALVAALNNGDTVNYDNSLAVNVDLERATQTGGEAQGDRITGVENIEGSTFGDTLRGDNKANVLFGNLGGDTLEGRGGADILLGGDGSDAASYESSDGRVDVDLIRGTGLFNDATGDTYTGIENIIGSRFADTLRGDELVAGNRIDGGGGDDILDGRGGNDVLDGGLGNDTLIGGEGIDTAEFDSFDTAFTGTLTLTPRITIDLSSGLATKSVPNIQAGRFDIVEQDTMSSIENARGSNNADLFIGTGGDNTFSGRDGNDTFRADAGRDTYNGDSGVDTVDYAASSAGITVNLNVGFTGAGGLAQGDRFSGVENIVGTSFKDTITGNNADNRLTGGGGDDTLNGGFGDDTIVGGTETDVEGLTGGAGRDTFLYLSRADSFTRADHTGDIITDFNTDQDLIDLRALGVNVSNLRLDDTGIGAARQGHLFEDLNGNGSADGNEFNINLQLSGSATFSLLDVLL